MKSKELKLKGNQCFKNGFYEKCLKLYSEAICLAPFPSDKSPPEERIELSMAFANRSAALFRVEDYDSCLLDIEDAIAYEYPSDMKSKLLIRKAQSLSSIGKTENAKQVLNDLIQSLNDINSDDNNTIKIKDEIELILKQIDENESKDESIDSDNDINDENNELIDRIENCNPLIPSASHSVKMNYNAISGRFMTANNDIKFGDTLLVEYPFVTYLDFDKFDSYCQHCLISFENRFIPCFGCNQIRFCSESCRDTAWTQYHKSECNRLLTLIKEMGISYIVFRIILKVGPNNAIKIFKQFLQKSHNEELENNVLYSGDYRSVISLLDHENDHNLESMISYSLAALFILYALERNSFIEREDENYIFLGALILKHIQQLSTNLISILEQNIFEEFNKFGLDAKEDIIGTAIYPTISLLNHSCDPNVMTFFRG